MTISLRIGNVSGCDLVSILTSLKCHQLYITWQSLRREETQALVQAMESGVKKVTLWPQVKLDMEVLTEYSGQGQCTSLCQGSGPRYREELRTWARSRKWRLMQDDEIHLSLSRL